MAEFTDLPIDLPGAAAPKPAEDRQDRKEKRRFLDVGSWFVLRGKIDVTFLLLTLLLLGIGLAMLLSASFVSAYYDTAGSEAGPDSLFYFRKQVFFAAVGIVVMLGITLLPYRLLRNVWVPLVGMILVTLLLLVVVVKTMGISSAESSRSHGADRWIVLGGGFRFQPSELLKPALIYTYAVLGTMFRDKMGKFRYGVLPYVLLMGVYAVLLLLQPHLSATVIVIAVTFIMMWASGTKWQWLVLGIVLMWVAYQFVVHNREFLLKITEKFNYIYSRIDAWHDPTNRELEGTWQIRQSLNAIGSGGFLGLGLGQSRQKYLYLPEEHNDYIFSIVCEELGFVGAVLILALFAVLVVRGYWLAVHCRNRFDSLLITGFTSHLALQVLLNVAVVTNLFPATGISLPFFSYGGTALIMQLAEIGVILFASRGIEDK
jgi:cell division protein FtsW